MGASSGAHQAMLLGMRPHDPRYASLSFSNGAVELDGTLSCVILVSPVTDPLGRYQYAKGLRDDCTSPAGMAERVAPMHDMYWVTKEAMAEAAPARFLACEKFPRLRLARLSSYDPDCNMRSPGDGAACLPASGHQKCLQPAGVKWGQGTVAQSKPQAETTGGQP